MVDASLSLPPGGIHAEETGVHARHILTDEHNGLVRQLELLIQFRQFPVEVPECDRHSRSEHSDRRDHLADLAATEHVHHLHHETPGTSTFSRPDSCDFASLMARLAL